SVVGGNPLDRRHGRSCDLQTTNDDDKPDKYDNPIAQEFQEGVVVMEVQRAAFVERAIFGGDALGMALVSVVIRVVATQLANFAPLAHLCPHTLPRRP
ncbi:hypothetical protein TELCIR_10962, partial [Teladorsagia circumcincta]